MGCGSGVDADGVESGVAEQFSDDDEVGAAADEGGGAGYLPWIRSIAWSESFSGVEACEACEVCSE
jgi:hypothetical protein